MMNVIFGNYGKNTLALIQWAYEQRLEKVSVLHVDTGWAADEWSAHVKRAQKFVTQCGFEPITLTPRKNFEEQVIDRGHFPSQKFQWCASFLKGLPLLEWLDQRDSSGCATLLLGSRRMDSRARHDLPEVIEESEHYGERRVWYPLYQHSHSDRDILLATTGFTDIPSRSLECQPCLHAGVESLPNAEKTRLKALESKIGQEFHCSPSSHSLESFDMGCGSRYACGE